MQGYATPVCNSCTNPVHALPVKSVLPPEKLAPLGVIESRHLEHHSRIVSSHLRGSTISPPLCRKLNKGSLIMEKFPAGHEPNFVACIHCLEKWNQSFMLQRLPAIIKPIRISYNFSCNCL